MHERKKTESPALFLAALAMIIQMVCVMVIKKWKASASRKAEIRMLAVSAAQEAEHTDSVSAVSCHHLCAVCFNAAARRCSRCKSVRYCSGKCQIIHWRQGHKEVCQPPNIYSSGTSLSRVATPRSELDVAISPLKAQNLRSSKCNLHEPGTSSYPIQNLEPYVSEILETSSLKFSHEVTGEILDPEGVDVIDSIPKATHTSNVDPRVPLPSVHLSTCRSFCNTPTEDNPMSDIPTCEIPQSDVHTSCRVSLPNVLSSGASSPRTENNGVFKPGIPVSEGPNSKRYAKDASLSMATALDLPVYKTCTYDLPVSNSSLDYLRSSGSSGHDLHSSMRSEHDHSSTRSHMVDLCIPKSPGNTPPNPRSPICDPPTCKSPVHSSSSTQCNVMDASKSRTYMCDDPNNISVLDDLHHRRIVDDSPNSGVSLLSSSGPQKIALDNCSGRCSMLRNGNSSCTERTSETQSAMSNKLNDHMSAPEFQSQRASLAKGTVRRSFGTAVRYFSRGRARASFQTISSEKYGNSSTVSSSPTLAMGSSHRVGSDLKMSLKKVLKWSKSSKASKQTASRAMNGNLAKSRKMLFPYESFVKLFNCNMLELYPCGLINCGNSCYANVVLQCLTYTRPLAAYLLQGYHSEYCQRKDGCFTCELESFVLRVREGESPLSPIRMLSQIQNIRTRLSYGRQEDAHELLRLSIDVMQSICLDEAGGEKVVDQTMQKTTFIQQMFGGYLQSKVQCMRCQYESNQYENMLDLTVEIHGSIESLEDALLQFTTPELLDGENKYKCDRCKSYVKARKQLIVHEAPNILTIALKRYKNGKFGKLNKHVAFPEVLDMSPYMSGVGDEPPLYMLYAVVVHLDMLNASFSGHYVCYVKDLQGSWYKIDDIEVNPVELHTVMSEGAYMLLYSRSSPRPPAVMKDGIIQSCTVEPVNHCTYDSEDTFLLSGHNESFSVHDTQVSLWNSFTDARMDDIQSSIVWNLNGNANGIDSSDEYNVDAYGFSYDGVFPFTMDLDTNSTPNEHTDLTSSDVASLFSSSDEVSWSTDSNRDSSSTVDFSERIFG